MAIQCKIDAVYEKSMKKVDYKCYTAQTDEFRSWLLIPYSCTDDISKEITRQIQSHDAFKLVNRVRLGQTGGLSLMLSLDLYLPDRGLGSAEVQ